MLRHPPIPPSFPYTTLFRSGLYLGVVGQPDPGGVLLSAQQLRDGPAGAPQRQILEVFADVEQPQHGQRDQDRKSTRLNSSHVAISYAVFCLKKKNNARRV